MTASLLTCETDVMPAAEPSPAFLAVAREFAELNAQLDAKRKELLPLMLEEVRRDVYLSKLAKASGYTQQHIARLARDAGIEPRYHREPPRRKPAADES